MKPGIHVVWMEGDYVKHYEIVYRGITGVQYIWHGTEQDVHHLKWETKDVMAFIIRQAYFVGKKEGAEQAVARLKMIRDLAT